MSRRMARRTARFCCSTWPKFGPKFGPKAGWTIAIPLLGGKIFTPPLFVTDPRYEVSDLQPREMFAGAL